MFARRKEWRTDCCRRRGCLDGLYPLRDGGKTCALKYFAQEDVEPDFDLIEPTGRGGCEGKAIALITLPGINDATRQAILAAGAKLIVV